MHSSVRMTEEAGRQYVRQAVPIGAVVDSASRHFAGAVQVRDCRVPICVNQIFNVLMCVACLPVVAWKISEAGGRENRSMRWATLAQNPKKPLHTTYNIASLIVSTKAVEHLISSSTQHSQQTGTKRDLSSIRRRRAARTRSRSPTS